MLWIYWIGKFEVAVACSWGLVMGEEVKAGEALREARAGARGAERLSAEMVTVWVVAVWFETKACA